MLHSITQSPTSDGRWSTIVQMILPSDVVLLLQNGVIAGLNGSAAAAQLLDLGAPIYVLIPDLMARGLMPHLAVGITPIDYHGFVALTVQHQSHCAW
jgi:tRNA 2-thiouridine synthesizing protein B